MNIKKVYIITGSRYRNFINTKEYQKIESDYLSGIRTTNTYGLDLTHFFIRKLGKDNVINCALRTTGEYKNILRYKGFSTISLIREIWRHKDTSLLIFHGFIPNGLIYSLIPTKHKVRWRHGIIGRYRHTESKTKWMVLWCIQKFFQFFMHTIWYVNASEKKELECLGYQGNLHFLPIPINTEFWTTKRDVRQLYQTYHKSDKEIFITSIGTIQHRKNQKLILEAIHQLPNKDNVVVHFVGGVVDPAYYHALVSYAAHKNIHVKFHGNQSSEYLRDILQITDIYIQASFVEGQCQTVMEAGLVGCPLILSAITSFIDTFDRRVAFFDPHNAIALAQQIQYIGDHLEIHKHQSQDLQSYLIDHWSLRSFQQQCEAFYSQLVTHV